MNTSDLPSQSDQTNQTNQPLISPTSTKKQKSVRRNILTSGLAAIVVAAVAWAVIGSRAITPPVIPQAPTNLRTFTGGKDIAVLWNGTQNPTSVKQYNVYRDGKLIAQVAPTNDSTYLTSYGTRYYDANVQAGKTYKYQISMTTTKGTTSGWSQAISATHPTTSSAVPTITVDSSAATDLTGPMNEGRNLLLTWYPKMANILAWPDYTPSTAITLKVDPNYKGIAGTVGTTVTISADYLRNNPKDMGMFIHEATHVLQQYTAYTPGFLTEGIADWARENIFNDRNTPTPSSTAVYTDGYSTSAYFLNWISSTYNKPNIVRTLNITARNGGSYASVFTNSTGKSVGQLWTQMTGRTVSSLGPVTGISSRCLDLMNYDTTPGNTIQLLDCKKNSAQDWVKVAEPAAAKPDAFSLRVRGKCMDVKYSGKAAGTPVWIWDCNGGLPQQWVAQPDGTLKNPNSGMCLQTKGGANTNGTPLEIAVCTGSAAQKWGLPPV